MFVKSGPSADIDGGYTEWSEWSSCSVTLGSGLQRQSRTCTNPKPEGNGKTCKEQGLGPAEQTQACDADPYGKLKLKTHKAASHVSLIH